MFKISNFEKYDGTNDPIVHVRIYLEKIVPHNLKSY